MSQRSCCPTEEGKAHLLICPLVRRMKPLPEVEVLTAKPCTQTGCRKPAAQGWLVCADHLAAQGAVRDMTKEGEETKETLSGGATRTKSPYRFDLIPANTDKRTALRFGLGAQKHGEGNWQQGDYTFVVSCVNHLRTHLNSMIMQEDNAKDDNIGAMLWNIHAIGWYEDNKTAEFAKAMAYLHRGVKP